jgi:glycosyltransferase involved in cell wall biosynthesis
MDAIRLGLISCWYKEKSCGMFAHNLAHALEELGVDITVVSANCLCFRDDPFHPDLFFSSCQTVKFADFYWKPAPKAVNYVRSIGELSGDALKGCAYLNKAQSLHLLHYQQTQGSFGFLPLLSFLAYPTQAKRVVAIHEIDAVQKQLKVRTKAFPTVWLNKIYHKADAVIVQTRAAKEALEDLGIDSTRVQIIPHGTHIPELNTSSYISRYYQGHMGHQGHQGHEGHQGHQGHQACQGCIEGVASSALMQKSPAQQIVFCGGHHLTSGKGFDVFLKALLILKEQNITPNVMIYGLNAAYGQGQGQELICELGIENRIKWFDYKSDDSLFEELQRALCMVIPYTTSEAGNSVTAAMANAVPVIATRRVGLPEYLDNSGLYIEEGNPQDLADKILRLIHDPGLRETLGMQLYQRALELYSWEAIAQKTLDLYLGLLGGGSQGIRINPAVTKC